MERGLRHSTTENEEEGCKHGRELEMMVLDAAALGPTDRPTLGFLTRGMS